ncbi:MAG: hypothetical protein ACOCUT_04385 [bacterium]
MKHNLSPIEAFGFAEIQSCDTCGKNERDEDWDNDCPGSSIQKPSLSGKQDDKNSLTTQTNTCDQTKLNPNYNNMNATGPINHDFSVLQLVECFDEGASFLVFHSFRYFLGRMTASTADFAERLASAWPLIDKQYQDLIRKELERQFELDDKIRQKINPNTHYPLGMDCDRFAWEKVRMAYSDPDPSNSHE